MEQDSTQSKNEELTKKYIAERHGDTLDKILFVLIGGGFGYFSSWFFSDKLDKIQSAVVFLVLSLFGVAFMLLYISYISSIKENSGGKGRSVIDNFSYGFLFSGMAILWLYIFIFKVIK